MSTSAEIEKKEKFEDQLQHKRKTMAKIFLASFALLMAVPGFFSAPLDREERQTQPCITDIYVLAHTFDASGAGTNHVYSYIFVAGGQSYSANLHDMPYDQASKGKGDLWKLNLQNHFHTGTACIRKNEITSAAIEEGGTDGWRIDSVVSAVKAGGSFEVLTLDMEVNQWIDRDGNSQQQPGVVRKFYLNLV